LVIEAGARIVGPSSFVWTVNIIPIGLRVKHYDGVTVQFRP